MFLDIPLARLRRRYLPGVNVFTDEAGGECPLSRPSVVGYETGIGSGASRSPLIIRCIPRVGNVPLVNPSDKP